MSAAEAKWHMIIVAGAPMKLTGDAYKQKMTDITTWAKGIRQKLEAIKPPIVLGGYSAALTRPCFVSDQVRSSLIFRVRSGPILGGKDLHLF